MVIKGVEFGICEKQCTYPCETCKNNVCKSCSIGFTLNTHKKCVFDETTVCTNGICGFCPMGFSMQDDGSCSPCYNYNCAVCNGNVDICTTCYPGYYSSESNFTCIPCGGECETCFDADTCDLCAPGYSKEVISMNEGASDAVFSDKCVLCNENCKTCYLEPDRCQSCHEGYRLSTSNRCIGDFTV